MVQMHDNFALEVPDRSWRILPHIAPLEMIFKIALEITSDSSLAESICKIIIIAVSSSSLSPLSLPFLLLLINNYFMIHTTAQTTLM